MEKLNDMTFEEAMPLYEALHNKKPLEYYVTEPDSWIDMAPTRSGLRPELAYRVKAAKPSIDWSHLKSEIVAIAEDPSHALYGYTEVPCWSRDRRVWTADGPCVPLEGYASYVPGTCAPEDSLVLRPGVESDGWIEWGGGELQFCPENSTERMALKYWLKEYKEHGPKVLDVDLEPPPIALGHDPS